MTDWRLAERQNLRSIVSTIMLLLSHFYINVNGIVEVSPSVSGVTPICQMGDELVLTCTISGQFMRWIFTVTLDDGTLMTFMPAITAGGSGSVPIPSMVNSTTFTYSILSTQPLISTMTVHPVSQGLNGVDITCSDIQTTESAATTIQIIIGHAEDTQISNFSVHSGFEQFTEERVRVSVEWSVSLSQVYYHQLLRNASIVVVPDIGVTAIDMGNRTFLLSLMYNRQYNVSLTQPGICGQPNQTAFITLNYTRCNSPISLIVNDVEIVGHEDPALEGQSIMFTCRSGFKIKGPNSSTCMENGQWTPNPRDVNCSAVDCERPSLNSNVIATYNSTLMDTRLFLTCEEGSLPSGIPTSQCYSNRTWTPNPAEFYCESTSNSNSVDQSVAVITALSSSIVVGVVLFLIGCASGWFAHKHKIGKATRERSEKNNPLSSTQQPQPAPVYEDLDLQPTSKPDNREKNFELKENIAYGPVKST